MTERTYYSEDAKNEARVKITAVAAFCLAIGATIGTALAVLFAPQSGQETRDNLSDASESAIGRLQDQIDDLRQRFDSLTS